MGGGRELQILGSARDDKGEGSAHLSSCYQDGGTRRSPSAVLSNARNGC